MSGDYADDLVMLQDRNFADPDDAMAAAQDFADMHRVKMSILLSDFEQGGYYVSDQPEAEVHDEALPNPE